LSLNQENREEGRGSRGKSEGKKMGGEIPCAKKRRKKERFGRKKRRTYKVPISAKKRAQKRRPSKRKRGREPYKTHLPER